MLDQKKMGEFISEMRRNKGITQREMAEALDISDKTVSKWETGRGIPDVSIMLALCAYLEISVNELLAGQRLSKESYTQKAEEHIMELMKTTEKNARTQKWSMIGGGAGFVMLLLFYWAMYQNIVEMEGVLTPMAWFIDFPALFGVLGTTCLVLGCGGVLGDLFGGIRLCVKKGRMRDGNMADTASLKRAESAVHYTCRTVLLSGVFGMFFSIPVIVHGLADPSKLGPSLAVAVLTMFYGCLFALFLLPVSMRLHRLALELLFTEND